MLSVLPYYIELMLQQDTVRISQIHTADRALIIAVEYLLQIFHLEDVQTTSRLSAFPSQSHHPPVNRRLHL